ncbi:MAG: hypothetical protein M0Z65_12765 [Firmicutes bacterium]|uniref:Uncharacterized protein n=1 Tax=Melghirimyces thermohalophilus TaxID=1236220 RepID=A0A1G6I6Z2_9BACL|nr:hypothetical protein [Melghirimyces thermohalophilus]MDA8354018.1 hypothetical protein [Bacillota bacterium]SDC02198.1 hypothetical protein SAMN04488112_10287 [Melghirimyces thermohalophilus]
MSYAGLLNVNVLLFFMMVICVILMVLYIRERGKNKLLHGSPSEGDAKKGSDHRENTG